MQTMIMSAALFLTVSLIACSATAEPPPGMAQATFAVHCYDVGAHALDGKPGVISVARGWQGSREVDRVVYNPDKVSILQLEDWLKEAETYVDTLEQSLSTATDKETSQ